MASHKVLRSIAHNMVHGFTSMMNYIDDDYAMGHILKAARATGNNTITIDLLQKTIEPPTFHTAAILKSAHRHMEWFPNLVSTTGSSVDFVAKAVIQITYDLDTTRPCPNDPRYIESPYSAVGRLVDDRGKIYEATLEGWWFPES